jgi:hypothetical protein
MTDAGVILGAGSESAIKPWMAITSELAPLQEAAWQENSSSSILSGAEAHKEHCMPTAQERSGTLLLPACRSLLLVSGDASLQLSRCAPDNGIQK